MTSVTYIHILASIVPADMLRLPSANTPIIQQEDESVPLCLIQVSPILTTTESYVEQLSSPTIKLYLQNIAEGNNTQLKLSWDDEGSMQSSLPLSKKEDKKDCRNDHAVMRISAGTIYSSKKSIQSCERIKTIFHKKEDSQIIPLMMLPSSNPLNVDGVPCILRGYSIPYCRRFDQPNTAHHENLISDRFFVGSGAIVQITPPVISNWMDRKEQLCRVSINQLDDETSAFQAIQAPSLCNELSGISNVCHEFKGKDTLLCYDSDTVRVLTIRMKMLLESQIMVGTTEDAISQWNEERRRHERMANALDFLIAHESENTPFNHSKDDIIDNFLRDGALTIHDPLNCSGKTTLVATIAAKELKCQAVHIINATALFAQYGASGADAALESLLHHILVSAAAKGVAGCTGSVCIILDHLETFVPASMSGGRNDGDPAIPALNAIRKYHISN